MPLPGFSSAPSTQTHKAATHKNAEGDNPVSDATLTLSSNDESPARDASSDPASIMFGQCDAMQKVFTLIRKVAPTETTVLIQGESGTGKELAARALHLMSPRALKTGRASDCSRSSSCSSNG